MDFARISNRIKRIPNDAINFWDRARHEVSTAWQKVVAKSIHDGRAIDDWWETVHASKGQQLWLSSTKPEQIWEWLGVTSMLKPGLKTLNIGVGLGRDTKGLSEKGLEVHVLDIAPSALKRVEPFVTKGYLASNKAELPSDYFSLALSYLVTQHVSNEEFSDQLRHVFRALKSDGIFAFQFASVVGAETTSQQLESQKGGGVCRSPQEVEKMVELCGGRVVLRNKCWEKGVVAFYSFHAMRRETSAH